MIELTVIEYVGSYDDIIYVNPHHIRTMRRVVIGDDPDLSIIATQIDIGTIITDDDGNIATVHILVSEEIDEILMRMRVR